MSDHFTTPLTTLRTMLAASTTFQTFVAAGSADDALEKIFLFELFTRDRENSLDGRRPFAVLGLGPSFAEQVAGGGQNYLRDAGALWVYLTANHDGAEDCSGSGLAFAAAAGGILGDLAGVAGVDDQLSIIRYQVTVPPQIVALKDRPISAYWECLFELSWR